jgi:hypothetical protein
MAEPIVFISRFRIVDGNAPTAAAMLEQAVPAIADSKPRTSLFAAYVDADGAELRVIHAFPDASAMTDHFLGSDERSGSIAGLVDAAGFEVYGPAPTAALDQLRREAEAAGTPLSSYPWLVAGFLRPPT